jgi:hypothetical protein
MHQESVGIAPLPDREGLAGSGCNDVNVYAACGSKDRKNVPEKTGVLGRGSRTEGDELVFGLCRVDEQDR